MKNSSYYIAPVGDWTHDLPHTVASNMVKVSHALNHSATEAVACYSPLRPKRKKNDYCYDRPVSDITRVGLTDGQEPWFEILKGLNH